MIWQSLLFIMQELDSYLQSLNPTDPPPLVVGGNIGMSTACGGTETFMDGRVVLSVVNSMEEDTLRNSPPLRVVTPTGTEHQNAPIFLNLYLLFTASFGTTTTDPGTGSTQYGRSMTRISQIIGFFQGKREFSIQNTQDPTLILDPDLQDLKIKMEMVSLSFEQINYLWGSLGGKQLPFVMFKAHVVPIRRENLTARGGIVQDIITNTLNAENLSK